MFSSVPKIEAGGSSEIFRKVVEDIAEIAQQSGVRVVAGNDKSWALYRALPKERKHEALQAALVYSEICRETIREGRPLTDTRRSLWASLRHFGMLPHSDLMNHVTDDMVVELYTAAGHQLYRNLKFLELCSYTLAEVFIHPWYELFERNEKMMTEIGKEVAMVLEPGASTIFSNLGPHHMIEAFSAERFEFEMTFEKWSPVYIKGQSKPCGFVCMSRANRIEIRPPLHPQAI